jgi:hypothetical protein
MKIVPAMAKKKLTMQAVAIKNSTYTSLKAAWQKRGYWGKPESVT